ncbi:hypothetical protein GV819_04040 [Pseudomonas sp. Fl5BN2]|uniref:hypothetical protein n=1 Tax=unclassified Pseudomonas TaxID=196821 RepID=UPI001378A216|nr:MULTISPECIES: hypothetical protein [unclassified Pseudomonas]NBF01455.1 hypothetical protein [Pseudomonas sp. Fl5BN2]NBF08345.1 hypothetical protein [Pseudomonas sp. Fl4BN1]
MSRHEPLFDNARDVADLFRLGRDVEAAVAMIELFDPVQGLVDGAPSSAQQDWAALLGLMLKCQEAQDWLGLADYLEYELVDWLQVAFAD